MSTTERATCASCESEQLLKTDGTFRKHSGPDSSGTCGGSGRSPEEVAAELADSDGTAQSEDPAAEGDATAENAAGDDSPGEDDWLDLGDDDEPVAPSGETLQIDDAGGEGPVRDFGHGAAAYEWLLTIKHPAIYLSDPAWHHENGLMAVRAAQEAGHTVTGEAQWAGDTGGGPEEGTVLLTYLVPVTSP